MPGSTRAGNQHYRIPSQKAFKFYVVSKAYDKSMCNVIVIVSFLKVLHNDFLFLNNTSLLGAGECNCSLGAAVSS